MTIDSVPFSWDRVEQFPQLQKLQHVLDVLPYDALVNTLAKQRGKGHNDFPVEPLPRFDSG